MKPAVMPAGRTALLLLALWMAPALLSAAEGRDPPAPVTIDADGQLEIAARAFQRGEYFRAVVEYERFIFFFPRDHRLPAALLQVGRAYQEAGSNAEAIVAYGTAIDRLAGRPEVWRAYFGVAECQIAQGEPEQALATLEGVAAVAGDDAVADEARFRAGLVHAMQGDWERARAAFGRIDPQRRARFRLEALEVELNRADQLPRKDPAVAGWLSLVPGAGFLYTERYRDAAVAFLLNAGLISASCEAFRHDSPALGSVIGFVAAGFYAGNIYGAISSAHKVNRRQEQGLMERIQRQVRLELSAVDSGMVFGLRAAF
jgi:tetratricopeptide (TPR) repeat protein